MKTTEEIVAEIDRRIDSFSKLDAKVFGHAIVALGLLLVWIESDDEIKHDVGEESTIVHKGEKVIRTFRNEDY